MTGGRPSKSLMRSLGEFVGHITRAVKTDVGAPADPPRNAVPAGGVHTRRHTQEHTVRTPEGRMVLRRTVIEEVELRPSDRRPDEDPA